MEATAEAILAVVNQRMAGRIRLMSIERGLDPRDFAFVAFGGAGPLHGGALIREVGISTMLVPLYPGVLCALGCAYADLRYDLSQTLEKRVDRLAARRARGRSSRASAQQGEQQLDRQPGAGRQRLRSRTPPTWPTRARSMRCACRSSPAGTRRA